MKKYTYILFLFLIIGNLFGCNYFPYFEEGNSDTENQIEHTLIVYVPANSSLVNYQNSDILEIINSVDNNFSNKARIVIYYDRYENEDKSDSTTLFLLKKNNIPASKSIDRLEIIKQYTEQDAMDPIVMQNVLNDIKELVPSRSYGIVISGHGTGWFPVSTGDAGTNTDILHQRSLINQSSIYEEHHFEKQPNAIPTRWLGTDNYLRYNEQKNSYEQTYNATYMSAQELAQGLSPIKFDYIIFDACFMSSIEMLYELRNNADYIMASPTEILADGFPYQTIINGVFNKGMSLHQIAEEFINYYRSENAVVNSASIAIINCTEIQNLAEKVRQIYLNGTNDIIVDNIQALDGIRSNHVFFDMNCYMKALCTNEALYEEYLQQFNKTVIFNDNTDYIYSQYGEIPVLGERMELCGVSAYIPREELPVTKNYYDNTDWAKFTQQ